VGLATVVLARPYRNWTELGLVILCLSASEPAAMPIYKVTDVSLQRVPETSFAAERLLERRDLQRLLRADTSPLGEDLLVLAEEFSDWDASHRRIDLLCLDREARLVVVELKRTDDGGHMELQAVRYAAMVSTLTLERAVAIHARMLVGEDSDGRALKAVLEFLDISSLNERSGLLEVRILLVAAEFSTELTTSVLWLNDKGLDIVCVRLKPYRLEGQVLLDVSQIVPLPEARDYVVRVREQAQDQRKASNERQILLRRFWSGFIERSKKRTPLFGNRSTTNDHWMSAGIGRSGFGLNVTLTQDIGRVEVYIRIPGDDGDRSARAFELLQAQRSAIEAKFGGELDWQPLPERAGSRICIEIPGGWRLPEDQWPGFQEELIALSIRLADALREPVQLLDV
jgi:hypothetical protein